MGLWETPEAWSTEFLRSQKFNKEIRDKQNFLFKRPRAQVILQTAGTFATTTTRAAIDVVAFAATIEKTARPLLVHIIGTQVKDVAATTNNILYFDVKTSDGLWASSRGLLTPLSLGAAQFSCYNANQAIPFVATILIDWLDAGVWTITPYWWSTVAMSFNTSSNPLELIVEEI
jgi:hypothetical protein